MKKLIAMSCLLLAVAMAAGARQTEFAVQDNIKKAKNVLAARCSPAPLP